MSPRYSAASTSAPTHSSRTAAGNGFSRSTRMSQAKASELDGHIVAWCTIADEKCLAALSWASSSSPSNAAR